MISLDAVPSLSIDGSRAFAVLADLHANLEALTAVDSWLRRRGIDQAIVLGDLIGYGASPLEVLELVRYRGWPCLRGNHEEIVLGLAPETIAFKRRAVACAEWTRAQISPRDIDFLASMPTIARIGEDVLAVHGSLVDRRHCYAYIYDLSLDLNVRALAQLAPPPGTLVLHGHTHRPAIFATDGRDWESITPGVPDLALGADRWYFVNPGSVGYSRDGDTRASFMTWEPETRRLDLHRLEYNIHSAVDRIRTAGYSDDIAERLLAAR